MNENFLDDLAAKKPTPGGGGVAALLGCLTSALGCMVCNFTIGKKKYKEYDEENKIILKELTNNMNKFNEYITLDAQAFMPLSEAYKLPSDTDEQKQEKQRVLEPLLVNSALVPLNVMRLCAKTLDLIDELLNKSSAIVLSDVGVAASCSKSCIESAALNVFINTKLLTDKIKKEEIERETFNILDKYIDLSDKIYKEVKNRLYKE